MICPVVIIKNFISGLFLYTMLPLTLYYIKPINVIVSITNILDFNKLNIKKSTYASSNGRQSVWLPPFIFLTLVSRKR